MLGSGRLCLVVSWALCGLVACAGEATRSDTAANAPPEDHPDYLLVAPRAFEDELAPLVALRTSQGHEVAFIAVEDIGDKPRPEDVNAAIRRHAEAKGSRVRFVLLAGDPTGSPALPSFRGRLGEWAYEWKDSPYFSDQPYAQFDKRPLAVGRLPARSEAEMSAMVGKIVRYETVPAGDWQRRVMVVGSPANFGPVADAVIEWQATTLLDQLLPYDYDVNVLFAKPDSPYAYPFDRLGKKIIEDINAGALLAVYAGHGNPESFDDAYFQGFRFPIGTVQDLDALDAKSGSPVFISLTCHTGTFGAERRSIGETLMLNQKGPVAVFASSQVSHPYPNYLFAETLLENLLGKRTATLGEGIVAAKLQMPGRRILAAELLDPGDHDATKAEHLYLYNLLGDPATRLRYPQQASMELSATRVAAGSTLRITANAAGLGDGTARVTLETERREVKPGMTPVDMTGRTAIDTAFETMSKNHALACDKVVERSEKPVKGGKLVTEIAVPSKPGRYVIKALLSNGKEIAATHARFEVEAGPGRVGAR